MSGGYTQWTNGYFYDWQGNLKSGSVGGANPYNFNYTYSTDNQITRRDQRYSTNTTNVHEVHYYFNGIGIGDISNNGSSNVDYAQGIAKHRAVQGSGPFQSGASSGTAYSIRATTRSMARPTRVHRRSTRCRRATRCNPSLIGCGAIARSGT